MMIYSLMRSFAGLETPRTINSAAEQLLEQLLITQREAKVPSLRIVRRTSLVHSPCLPTRRRHSLIDGPSEILVLKFECPEAASSPRRAVYYQRWFGKNSVN